MTQNGHNKSVREEVLKLIEKKEELETEIKELQAILDQNGVGMEDPLIDNEGFPLANIDLYQVRHVRHMLCCKQNDYKELMRLIELGIAEYYHHTDTSTATVQKWEEQFTEPFAKIHVVYPGSPADSAGIKDGDLVIEFGSVNKSNYRNLQDIGNVVSHSIGGRVKVKVKRNNQTFNVTLKPRKWDGQGMLGCNVVSC